MKIGNARGQRVYGWHIGPLFLGNTPKSINTRMQICISLYINFAKSHETVVAIAYSEGQQLPLLGNL